MSLASRFFLDLIHVVGGLAGQIFVQHLPDPIRQRTDPVGAKAQRTSTADAGELPNHFGQAFARGDGRGQPQHIRDEPADCL